MMRKFLYSTFAALTTIALSACGQSDDLSCDSSDTTDLIAQIEHNNPPDLAFSALEGQGIKTVFSVDAIRTEGKDATTGSVTCAAILHAKNSVANLDFNIQYKVEKTTDNKLFVTVTGETLN
jgi:hypothetical protein